MFGVLAHVVEELGGFGFDQRNVISITSRFRHHLRDQLAPDSQPLVCFHE